MLVVLIIASLIIHCAFFLGLSRQNRKTAKAQELILQSIGDAAERIMRSKEETVGDTTERLEGAGGENDCKLAIEKLCAGSEHATIVTYNKIVTHFGALGPEFVLENGLPNFDVIEKLACIVLQQIDPLLSKSEISDAINVGNHLIILENIVQFMSSKTAKKLWWEDKCGGEQ